LKSGRLEASNFLGLAGIRIEEGDVAGAVALLRRAELVSGDAFSTLEPSAALLEKTGHAAEAAPFLADLVKAEPWNWSARERLSTIRGSADELARIAKSAEAAYSARVAAALALRKMKAAPLAGTEGELMLLSSQTPLGENEVSKPYYVAARLEAAGLGSASATRDQANRVKLLSAAIAIDPRRDSRLALFRAAIEARQDALVVAIAREMLPPYLAMSGIELPQWQAGLLFNDVSQTDRIALVRGLAEAEQRLGDLRLALRYYQAAQQIEPSDRIQRAMETVRAQVAADAKNEARRPMVSANLEQDRLVHPKVEAR